MMSADLDLPAIEKRAAVATPGPWWAWDRGVGWHIAVGAEPDGSGPPALLPEGQRTDLDRREDAEFIAAARQDVPLLVDRVRKLQDALRSVLLHFPPNVGSGGGALYSGPVPVATVARWRSIVGPGRG